MRLKRLQYQYSYRDPLPLTQLLPRVDYPQLLKTLRFPLIWAFDELLQAWIPAETDYSFIEFVSSLSLEFDEGQLSVARQQQLHRYLCVDPPRDSLSQLQERYQRDGLVIIKSLFSTHYTRNLLTNYYWRNDHLHERWKDMPGIKRTSVNNMPLMRLLHQATEGLINKLVPEPVKTSYSFTSAYEASSTLPAHRDRPQCKYNVSLLLGSFPPRAKLSDWPLYIDHEGTVNKIELEHGDAVLYSGTQDLHWRDQLPANLRSVLGVFFHYVPVNFSGSLE